jgi:hypothetical protein
MRAVQFDTAGSKDMPPSFSPKQVRLQRGETVFREWANLRAVLEGQNERLVPFLVCTFDMRQVT